MTETVPLTMEMEMEMMVAQARLQTAQVEVEKEKVEMDQVMEALNRPRISLSQRHLLLTSIAM